LSSDHVPFIPELDVGKICRKPPKLQKKLVPVIFPRPILKKSSISCSESDIPIPHDFTVFFRSHFSYGSIDTSAEAIKHDKTCTEACTGWHSEWWSETSSERRHCVDWWISSGASRQIEMGDGGDGLNLLPWWSWVLEKNGGQPTKQNGGFDWAKWWIWGFQKWCF
jgi:hypothetical protein